MTTGSNTEKITSDGVYWSDYIALDSAGNMGFGVLDDSFVYSGTEKVYPPEGIANAPNWTTTTETGYYTTTLSTGTYMDGEYKAWASSINQFGSNNNHLPCQLFDYDMQTNDRWILHQIQDLLHYLYHQNF